MIDLIVQMVNFFAGLLHISPDLLAGILGAALAISEALALIPFFKSNGILQMIINILKKAMGK